MPMKILPKVILYTWGHHSFYTEISNYFNIKSEFVWRWELQVQIAAQRTDLGKLPSRSLSYFIERLIG